MDEIYVNYHDQDSESYQQFEKREADRILCKLYEKKQTFKEIEVEEIYEELDSDEEFELDSDEEFEVDSDEEFEVDSD